MADELPRETLRVLYAIAVHEPVPSKSVARRAELDSETANQARTWLREHDFISGGSDARRGYCLTAKGQEVIQRADVSKERDVSRMLYLWSQQHGSG